MMGGLNVLMHENILQALIFKSKNLISFVEEEDFYPLLSRKHERKEFLNWFAFAYVFFLDLFYIRPRIRQYFDITLRSYIL